MNLIQALFLGVLQGATEFLPVSSSGHLVLVPWLLGWESPGLAFDAVVHWGTALAVILYFWEDWVSLVGAALRSLIDLGSSGGGAVGDAEDSPQRTLAWLIVLGTIPGILAGYFLEDFFERMFARPAAAAGFLLITAALLTASERLGRRERELRELGWVDALLVGIGQALAIFPGISRSGATIAAGLFQGMRREPAARFSFLLATPIVLGAGLLKVVELGRVGGLAAQAPMLAAGFATAAAVGFGCIHFLLQYLQRRRLYPFAAYCALFGVLSLLVWVVR
ncbi:MAG: undecaprenyl-diphosphate phosphatase [Chloroflexota bacterium]|nr:undecaprenyl-diphosphate phosphatase [Chloroflexota bacterium]